MKFNRGQKVTPNNKLPWRIAKGSGYIVSPKFGEIYTALEYVSSRKYFWSKKLYYVSLLELPHNLFYDDRWLDAVVSDKVLEKELNQITTHV